MTGLYFTLLILLVLSAAFSATETAVFSVGLIRLRTLAEKGDLRAALLERLRAHPQRLLGTLLLCNNAVNVGISAIATVIAVDFFDDAALGIATGVTTLMIVIFGEYAPKTYAAHNAERFAMAAIGPLHVLVRALSPIVAIIEWSVRVFTRFDGKEVSILVSEEEIRTMAKMGAKGGTVEHGERELIERVFLFNDITASDVLTPKEVMVTLDSAASLADAIPVINSSKFSRFPVYSRDRDDIVGILNIKDVFERISQEPERAYTEITVRELMTPPIFVAETELIDDLFRLAKKARTHMVLVRDKDANLVGLLTLEDLLEELVGEISDETDVDEHVIKRVDKHTVLVHGDTEIPDVNRFFNLSIPPSEHRTLARYIMSKAKGASRVGLQVELDDLTTATIEQVSKRRILRVRLSKKPSAS